MPKSINRSTARSARMVPKPCSKGTFSVRDREIARLASPALGRKRLRKYPAITAW
jgi:hypothetical protein